MDVNDNAFFLGKRVVLESIASKLAPTGTDILFGNMHQPNNQYPNNVKTTTASTGRITR